MNTLAIDFETRSELDLKTAGLHNYARHPSTAPWCVCYSFDNEEPGVWVPGDPCPLDINLHVSGGGPVTAFNAPFELEIWGCIMAPRFRWPELRVEQTYCTMAMAYAMGLPGNLENAAAALGLAVQKDMEGHALMLRMARPRSKNPIVWWDEPEKIARLIEYCKQDVRVENAVRERLVPLSDKERRLWLVDRKINARGVKVDLRTVRAAACMSGDVVDSYGERLSKLTDGAVQSVGAVASLKEWIAEQAPGEIAEKATAGLAKQAVVDLLARGDLPENVRAALTLRQEGAKTSTAKFNRIVESACADGRLRNLYQYWGSAPGRWAGRNVQVHNLVRNVPPAEVVEEIFRLTRESKHELIELMYGPPLALLAQCMRPIFVPDTGKVLVGGDYSAIESRGAAWFSGEQWKIDVHIAKDEGRGPGSYESTYARMFGVPVETVLDPSPERQIGKVCDLAFQYGGGVGSGITMGRTYGVKLPVTKWEELKVRWRQQHPCITKSWKQVERAAIAAVQNPGQAYRCGAPGREAVFKKVGSFLWLLLPSGRAQCFPFPKLIEGTYGPALTYMTVPDPAKRGKIVDDPDAVVDEDDDGCLDEPLVKAKGNSSTWARVQTYGGALYNRIIQGFCRDALADLILALDDMGAAIVLHTHDDCNIEVSECNAEAAKREMQRMMRAVPEWAPGLPLFAKCSVKRRYGT